MDEETNNYIKNMQEEISKRHEYDFGLNTEMKSYNESMSKVQGQLEGAFKDKNNPFFKSSYADLESIWGVARKPLADNGFSIMQTPCKSGEHLITTISHSSGAWVRGSWPLNTVKKDPQGYMASVTYARRGSLASMLGIYQTDDDGNEASNVDTDTKPVKKSYPSKTINKTVKSPQPKEKSEAEVANMVREVFDKDKALLSAGKVKTLTARFEQLDEKQKEKFFSEMMITEIAQIRQDEYVRANKALTKAN
jgi:hypothetical protein